MRHQNTLVQFSRYALIGVISNAILFALYILFTRTGVGHKMAMTLCFVIGVCQTFFFNKSWSFAHRFDVAGSFLRYWIAYLSAYVLNLVGLFAFVDVMGLAHELVQAAAVVVLALYLFLLQKLWVFRDTGRVALPTDDRQ